MAPLGLRWNWGGTSMAAFGYKMITVAAEAGQAESDLSGPL
jgi:hypothetical protein